MKKYFLFIFIVFVVGCSSSPEFISDNQHVYFEADLSNPSDDLFHVTVYPPKLNAENNIYNFVSTAPGTYQNLNIGRFVKSFTAYDKNGDVLSSRNITTNQWQFDKPADVYKIVYSLEDSYDTQITDDRIMSMSGTGIEDSYAIMNNFGVFGYFEGMQSYPIKLKVEIPDDWTAATVMKKKGEYYFSSSFDELSDSPILMGELTHASTTVAGINVDVYVYSDADFITADAVLEKANKVLEAAGKFLSYPIVDNYKFLLAFRSPERAQNNNPSPIGALEHSYCSFYALNAIENHFNLLDQFMAHEFFHIVTPLNLHSEIIEKYNFAKPVPTRHLWLHEGITEWVAHTMQLRDNLIDLNTYLARIRQKLNTSQNFYDDNYSIYDLSLEAYTPKGGQEYINIYQKGAVIATLLDLKLLDLSNGEKGLREVILDLTKKYGKSKPFPEKDFFNIFVKNTYPEIEDFINKYIKDAQQLPLEEYFEKVGVKYIYKKDSENANSTHGLFAGPNSQGKLFVYGLRKDYKGDQLKSGDIILKVNGENVSAENAAEVNNKLRSQEPGTKVEYLIERNGEKILIHDQLYKSHSYNNFEIMENPTPRQLKLRNIWTQNLPV